MRRNRRKERPAQPAAIEQVPVEPVAEDIRIVLNGGRSVMDNATVPAQWFFSPSVAEQAPTHLLIVDYTDEEFKSGFAGDKGRRYFVKITDTIKFLQIFRPGVHHLCFIAMQVQEGRLGDDEQAILAREDRCYKNSVEFNFDYSDGGRRDQIVGVRQISGWHYTLATTIVSIEVPEDLFAKRPERGIKRAFWNFVEGSSRNGPVDECEFRRDLLVWFPFKLAFYGSFRVMVGLIASLIILTLRVAVFIAGWRPGETLSTLGNTWNFNYPLSKISLGCLYHMEPYADGCPISGYRLWKVVPGNEEGGEKDRIVKMPVAPWQPILITSLVMLFASFKLSVIVMWTAGIAIACGGLMLLLAIPVLVSFIKGDDWLIPVSEMPMLKGLMCRRMRSVFERRDLAVRAEEQRKLDRDKAYKGWLRDSLGISHAPAKVDLNRLPEGFDGKLTRGLVVRFWAVKAVVCKPYPKY